MEGEGDQGRSRPRPRPVDRNRLPNGMVPPIADHGAQGAAAQPGGGEGQHNIVIAIRGQHQVNRSRRRRFFGRFPGNVAEGIGMHYVDGNNGNEPLPDFEPIRNDPPELPPIDFELGPPLLQPLAVEIHEPVVINDLPIIVHMPPPGYNLANPPLPPPFFPIEPEGPLPGQFNQEPLMPPPPAIHYFENSPPPGSPRDDNAEDAPGEVDQEDDVLVIDLHDDEEAPQQQSDSDSDNIIAEDEGAAAIQDPQPIQGLNILNDPLAIEEAIAEAMQDVDEVIEPEDEEENALEDEPFIVLVRGGRQLHNFEEVHEAEDEDDEHN